MTPPTSPRCAFLLPEGVRIRQRCNMPPEHPWHHGHGFYKVPAHAFVPKVPKKEGGT